MLSKKYRRTMLQLLNKLIRWTKNFNSSNGVLYVLKHIGEKLLNVRICAPKTLLTIPELEAHLDRPSLPFSKKLFFLVFRFLLFVQFLTEFPSLIKIE